MLRVLSSTHELNEQQEGIDTMGTSARIHADAAPRRSLSGADNPLARAIGRVRATVLAKMLVSFVGTVALLVMLGVLGLRVIGDSNNRVIDLGHLQQHATVYRQLQNNAAQVLRWLTLRRGSDQPDCADCAATLPARSLLAVDRVIVNTLSGLANAVDPAALGSQPPHDEQSALAQIARETRRLSEAMTRITAFDLGGDASSGLLLQQTDADAPALRLQSLTAALVTKVQGATDKLISDNDRAFADSQRLLVEASAVSIVVALLLGYLLSWSIVGPVRRMQNRLAAIALGDFTGHVAVSNRDELGALASDLNRMNDELRRLYKDLGDLNETLEARVRVQIDELEHLGRLRRFLSPQLADLVVSGGDESLLESHRREITVVFCDLRGFTAFSESAEPEQVMAVLSEFHTELGQLIFQFGGTLERFAGDALMMFFNDPFPTPDPTLQAVRMAQAMQERIAQLIEGWRKRGHDLGLGIGIAVGYATLGRIGFEGRFDYGAVGSVVNLAARLCGEALGGQILLADSAYAAVEGTVAAEPTEPLILKGFHRPVQAYRVTGLRLGDGVVPAA